MSSFATALNAEGLRNKAEWARYVADEIRTQGMARSKDITAAHGEAVPDQTNRMLYDTLTVPNLAAVEASFGRSRLLLEMGPDMAAMGIDAADSIQATNSAEKMLAHQLAATHKTAMELLAPVPDDNNSVVRAKRVNAAVRCLTAYQQGLLTLRKLRLNGPQRILVQYVNVNEGGQAVVGTVENSMGGK